MNQKILGQFTSQDYAKTAIIEPPSSDLFQNPDMRKTRVPFDSRTRNVALYPNQNSYTIEFDEIEDIASAQMVYCDIPMLMYLINNNFNTLYVSISNDVHRIVLTNGDYDENTLAIEMQTQLNTNAAGAVFTVAYVSKTDNYSFTSTMPFTLNFMNYKNSLNQLLGFAQKNYISSGADNTVLSEYRRNFNYNNYLIMNIDQFDVLKSSNSDLNKSFALIPKNYNNLNICDTFEYKKFFTPPLGRLLRIQIRFYDKFGNPYDFQNIDHRFELIFESYKLKRKYGHILTN